MGYLVKRRDDAWAVVLYLGRERDREGNLKERRLWRTVRGARREAERMLRHLEEQHDRRKLKLTRETLADYLNRWLLEMAPRTAGSTTLESYRMVVEKHLVPQLGEVRLDRLTPAHVNAYLGGLLTRGRRRVRRGAPTGLAAETVRRHYRVLHKALQDAVTTSTLMVNPAARPHVIPPRRQRQEMRTLSEVQVMRFLAEARSSRLVALYQLAIVTGMRQGELLGLRWRDVSLPLGTVSVQQIYYRGLFKGPKTQSSRRAVELDVNLVNVLTQHRVRQDGERKLFGEEYNDHDLVFCQPDGRPLDGQSLVRNEFRRLLRAADCPRVRFHDLRHTRATLFLEQGEHPKVVSERLGHSGVGITLDLYTHVVPGLQRQASARLTNRLLTLRSAEPTGPAENSRDQQKTVQKRREWRVEGPDSVSVH